jgi:hypothetical protein
MMTKDELIVKQQMEIEELKTNISDIKSVRDEVRSHLVRVEQWSTKCPDFPRIAMNGVVLSLRAME